VGTQPRSTPEAPAVSTRFYEQRYNRNPVWFSSAFLFSPFEAKTTIYNNSQQKYTALYICSAPPVFRVSEMKRNTN
jgi:hypothetical protein